MPSRDQSHTEMYKLRQKPSETNRLLHNLKIVNDHFYFFKFNEMHIITCLP